MVGLTAGDPGFPGYPPHLTFHPGENEAKLTLLRGQITMLSQTRVPNMVSHTKGLALMGRNVVRENIVTVDQNWQMFCSCLK